VLSLGTVRRRAAGLILAAGALPTALWAAGDTDLQEISPLVWVILAIAVGGAIITFAFLAYAVWKFRDPTTRGRRYG
jgi:TRAP-type C4-dicarboxylate transport system permease small subunit